MANNKIDALVTPEWLQAQFLETGLQVNDVSLLTNVCRTNISSWINGSRKMSAAAKAMFYYFFTYYKVKMREQQIKAYKQHKTDAFIDQLIKQVEKL